MKSIRRYSPELLREQAIDWLLRLRSETCTQSERRAFDDWLAQCPRHRQAYEEIQAQWEWMEPFKTMPFSARDQALRYRRKSRQPLFAYSAAAALLLALGLTAFAPDGWLGVSETYIAEKGDRQSITLADGSALELNTESEVRVYFNHWERRAELLRGEAFFTVTHDAGRPFEVHAGNGRIRDIGTAFEVYIKPDQVIVAVQEGIVEVQALGKRELNAGLQLAFNGNGEFQNLQDQDITALTAWRQGQLVFHDRRLDEVLAEVGRYHDTHIRLQDQKLGKLRVSGTFHTEQLNDILNAIGAILPVKVNYIGSREILLQSAASRS